MEGGGRALGGSRGEGAGNGEGKGRQREGGEGRGGRMVPFLQSSSICIHAFSGGKLLLPSFTHPRLVDVVTDKPRLRKFDTHRSKIAQV